MLSKLWRLLLLIFLFLLPWQTRWIFEPAYLNGKFWEYGSSSFYGTEILLWLIIILFVFDRLLDLILTFSLKEKEAFPLSSKERRGEVLSPLILFLTLAFFLFLAVEVLHSIDIGISYNFFFHLLEGLCIFLILSEEKERRPLLLAFWSGGIVQALFGAYQFFTQSVMANKWLGLALQAPQLESSVIESATERWLRAYGSFGSPNILGGYLAIVLIVGLILYCNQPTPTPPKRGLLKILLTLGQSIILVGLVLSFSRAAWLGAVVGILGLFMTRFLPLSKGELEGVCHPLSTRDGLNDSSRKGRQTPPRLPLERGGGEMAAYFKQLFFYSAIVLTLFIILRPLFITRLFATQRLEQYSLSERASQYPEAGKVFRSHPFLGVGPGAYTLALSKEGRWLPGNWYQPVHNIYILIIAEWGLIGAGLWLGIFVWLILEVRLHNPEFLPVIVMLFFLGAFDHYWWSLYSGMILWWTIFGLCIRGNINLYD